MSVVPVADILKYVNESRTNPQGFVKYVQEQIDQFFKDNRTLPLIPGCNYSTNQGKGAWLQCKQFLEKQKVLQPFKLSKGLCLAAQDHAADMATNNFQGHTGTDGSQPADRINRRCQQVVAYGVPIASGENIGGDFYYQGRNFALNSVKSLIIDDGVSNRGHRKNIYSTTFKYIGIGSRVVKGNKITVVMVFHSHDPAIKDSNQSSQAGLQTKPKKVHQQKQQQFSDFGGFKGHGGFGNNIDDKDFGDFGNFGDHGNFGNHQIQVSSGKNGDKYAVSTQKSTKTKTVNGKTIKVTTQTIKYSDGSIQTNENTQTYG